MNKEAMYKLSYGLFVLTAKEGKRHWYGTGRVLHGRRP